MSRLPQTPLSITHAQIAANSTEKVFARGEEYFRDGSVLSIARRGDVLHASVEGSEDEPYFVTAMIRNGEVADADCNCPYEYGGWCKHTVAVMLFALEAPEEIEIQEPLNEALDALTKSKIVQVLTRMAEDDPAFEAVLRAYLSGSPPKKRRDEDDWDS